MNGSTSPLSESAIRAIQEQADRLRKDMNDWQERAWESLRESDKNPEENEGLLPFEQHYVVGNVGVSAVVDDDDDSDEEDHQRIGIDGRVTPSGPRLLPHPPDAPIGAIASALVELRVTDAEQPDLPFSKPCELAVSYLLFRVIGISPFLLYSAKGTAQR